MKKILAVLFITILAVCGLAQTAFAADNNTPSRNEDRTYSFYNRELDRAMEWVGEAPNTELDKVLALYEYVCLNYDYDHVTYGHDLMIPTRKAACGGYTSLFEYLSEGAGITEERIFGSPSEQSLYDDSHAWNAVRVDGEWYFLDTTWGGDSTAAGQCDFSFFLKNKYNDAHLADFESEIYSKYLDLSTSSRFDNYWWYQTSGTEALANQCVPIPYDGAWYYVNRDYQIVKRTTAAENAEVTVFRDSGQDGINIGNHIAIKDGQLFFMGNTSGSDGQVCCDIYQVDMESNSVPVKVFTADQPFDYFGMKNNVICYNVSGEENIPIAIQDGYIPPSDLTITQDEVRYGDFVESVHFSAEVSPANTTNKKVDWALGGDCGAIDKDGNWRAVERSLNPQADNVYAFTEDGNVYKKINVTVPSAKDIGNINYIYIAHDAEDNHALIWQPAENATKYAVFRWYYCPYDSCGNRASESVREWLGETTSNTFALDENSYGREYVYGVTPVNHSGMGGLKPTNISADDYNPISGHKELIDYPRNVEIEQLCKGTIRVTWDAVEGAEGYLCNAAEEGSGYRNEDFIDSQNVHISGQQAIITGMKDNEDYLVFVAATHSSLDNCGHAIRSFHVNEMTCKAHLTKTEAVPAKCLFNGNEAYYTCDICGKYYSDAEGTNQIEEDSWVTSALGHDPGESYREEGQEATCTQEGYYYECMKCNRCGAGLRHDRITVPRLDHNLVKVDANPPTCMGSGMIEHWECTECGNSYASEEGGAIINPYLPPTGHDLKHIERKEATCTEDGNKEYWKCENCQAIFLEENASDSYNDMSWVILGATGHNWDNGTITTEATCSAEGETTYHCTKCDATRTEPIEVNANSHDWKAPTYVWSDDNSKVTATRVCNHNDAHTETETVNATSEVTTPPTCTEAGERTFTSAAFENEAFAVQTKKVEVPASGHSWDDGEVTTAPTCSAEGVKTFTCTKCDATRTETIEINENAHNWKAPTYVWSDDNSKVTATRVCNHNDAHTETETVNATSEVTTPPTCTEAGEKTFTSVAFENEAFAVQTKKVEVPASGHSWDEGTVTKEPTCSEEGVKTFNCTKCSATRTEAIDINANAHTPAEAVQENLVDATCSADGSFDEVTYCKDCNTELSRESKTIPATHHENTIEHIASKDATCLEMGNNEYWHCSKCGGYFSDANASEQIEENSWIIPAKGHLWDEGVTTEAGCIAGGSILYTCERCGDTNLVATDPKGHTPGEAVQENITNATCTSDGSYDEIVRCDVCNAELSKETKTIPATHHENTMEYTAAKAVTCTANGNSEYWYCTACGLYFSSEDGGEPIEENSWILTAPGHKWNTKYTIDRKATYAAAGSKSIHCSVCNVKKPGSAVAIPKLVVKATTLSKLSPAKKAITVKWKKGSSITGYQIQYALNSKFTSGKKTVTITKAGTVSKKITKLKAKKKYYVRVRTYKTVSGKKYYSTWSKYKYTKTK